jgi:hypothetical protein
MNAFQESIRQLEHEKEAIKLESARMIAEIDEAIRVMNLVSTRKGSYTSLHEAEQPVKETTQQRVARIRTRLDALRVPVTERPTDGAVLVRTLEKLGGRATIEMLYNQMLRDGVAFTYSTPNQQHGLSVGIAQKRHKYNRINHENGWYVLTEGKQSSLIPEGKEHEFEPPKRIAPKF